MMPKRESTHYHFVCNKGWLNTHLSSCDTSKVRLDEAVFSAYLSSQVQWYTRSPFVPCLPWLALSVVETCYGMRLGSIGSINSVHCLVIHLFVFEVQRLNLFSWSDSHNRKENTRRFPPEIITFVFISWPRYTRPHSINSVTWLLASVTQFRLLTYSMVQSPSWEANWSAASQEIPPHFTEPEGSLPHSKASATCLYPGPSQSNPYTHIPLSGDPS